MIVKETLLPHPAYLYNKRKLVCTRCDKPLLQGRDSEGNIWFGTACPSQFDDQDARDLFKATGLCQSCQNRYWDQYVKWRDISNHIKSVREEEEGWIDPDYEGEEAEE
jgi:uncharacterized protein with PIN domain